MGFVVPAKAGTQRLSSNDTGPPPSRGRQFCASEQHRVWASLSDAGSLPATGIGFTLILFLDFDGVLHPDPCYQTKRLFENAPRLAAVLDPFAEVCVVLSTSWRTGKTLDAMVAPLPQPLRERVIGVTPLASAFSPPPHLMPYRRHAECVQWMRTNGQDDRDWIALDDRASWFSPACEFLIVCDSQAGFNEEAAGRLRSSLTIARQRMLRRIDSIL